MAQLDLRGQTLGNFEIISELGRGAMGVVYKARQLTLNRIVAIKVLPPEFTYDQNYVARFQREAHSAANLEHPNIITIYEVGVLDNLHYIAMRYIEGETLRSVMQREGTMSIERALDLVAPVARALDYAHQRGIIHRDIKPSNIMIAQDGSMYLADFGLARSVEGASITVATGMVMGTPDYMSPEQAQGQSHIGPTTDIYALGIIIYQMVTGGLPFEGETTMSKLFARVRQDPVPPRNLRPDLSPAVEECLLRALAREPGQRYSSAGEMVDALRQATLKAQQQAMREELEEETVFRRPPPGGAGPGRTQPYPPPGGWEPGGAGPGRTQLYPPPGEAAPDRTHVSMHGRSGQDWATSPPVHPHQSTTPPVTAPAPRRGMMPIWIGGSVVMLLLLIAGGAAAAMFAFGGDSDTPAETPVATDASGGGDTTPTPTPHPTATPRPTSTPIPIVPAIDDVTLSSPYIGTLPEESLVVTITGENLDQFEEAVIRSEASEGRGVLLDIDDAAPNTLIFTFNSLDDFPAPPEGEATYNIELRGSGDVAETVPITVRDFIEQTTVKGVLADYTYTGRVAVSGNEAFTRMRQQPDVNSERGATLRNGDTLEIVDNTTSDTWYQARIRSSSDPENPVGQIWWIERWLVDNENVPAPPPPTSTPRPVIRRPTSRPAPRPAPTPVPDFFR